MALIERFTPGGNIYPDGSSPFAMLVQFFQRWAENRDAMDAQIATTAAVEAADAVAPNTLQPLDSDDAVFAVLDEDDRRTWVEIAADGGPTQYSAEKMAPAVAGPVAAQVGLEDQDTSTTGLSFAVVDEDGRRTDLEVDEDGHISPRAMGLWSARLGLGDVSSTDDRVICSGDSMTGGAGGANYPAHLATDTGWEIVNEGAGGETTVTIAGRMGGRPMLVEFPGGEIPADRIAVPVTFTSDTALTGGGIGAILPKPLLQQWAGFHPSVIAGVVGNLVLADRAAGTYTFTRNTAGTAVPINYPTPIHPASSTAYRGSIHVMWWGHNDDATVDGVQDPTDIIARQQAMIGTLAGVNPRWLVLGIADRTGVWRRPGDLQFLRAFGRRFINIGEYLSSTAAFEDAGLTPTSADETAIANGEIPPSFRIDGIHLTSTGFHLVARQVAHRIREMGWLD